MIRRCRVETFRWIFVLALFVLSLSITLPSALSGAGDFPQQKYPLTFTPTAGENFHYQIHTSLAVEGKDFQGKDLTLEGSVSGKLTFAIKRNIPNLIATAVTTPGIHVELKKLESIRSSTLKTNEPGAVRLSFNHRGEVTELYNLDALSTKWIGILSFEQLLREFLPTLPDKLTTVAETWSDSKTIKISLQEIDLEVMMNRKYSLLSVFPSEDGNVAAVSITYAITLSGSKNWEDWTAGFEGQGSGTGFLLYNIRLSCIREFNAEFGTKGALVIRKKDQPILEHPFNLSVSASMIQIQQHPN